MDFGLKFVKLDRRWKGHDMFEWTCIASVLPQYERFAPKPLAHSDLSKIINFNKLRDWCWDTWGPS